MISPSIFTDSAVSWYSCTSATICTSGATTRPDSIWNAISAPTVIVWSNTACAPTAITATGISFSRKPITACAVIEMRPTLKCRPMVRAERSSHSRRRCGSIAMALTVRMPWMVSTSIAWRSPSAV